MILEDMTPVRAAAVTNVTAGGAGDNTVVTGIIMDRYEMYNPTELGVAISFTATLASGKKLFLKSVLVEHGDAANLSDVATFKTLEDATGTAVATDPGGGSTITGCKKYPVHIGAAKRYIRLKFTPDMDATSVDTSVLSAIALFSGMYAGPAL